MKIKNKTDINLKSILIYSLLLNSVAALMWPLITVYMHNVLHKSLTVAGIVLFIMSCFMILGNYLGGYLFDHWSPYKSAIISITLGLISVSGLIFLNTWPIFAIMLFIYGLGEGASVTILNSYAATVNSKNSRYVFNSLYIGINVGVVIGTMTVGYLMKFGISIIFLISTGFYVVLLLMTIFEFKVKITKSSVVTRPQKEHAVKQNSMTTKLIFKICIMVFCIYLSYVLWDSVMPIHMETFHISFEDYSFIWVINGLLIVFVQPIVNKIGSHFKMVHQIAFGVLLFGLTFFMLIWTKQYGWFIVVMVLLTFGEMNGLPSIPAWINNLSDQHNKGKYQGMFNMAMSLGRAVGPLFGGLVVEWLNYSFLFAIAGILVIISMIVVMIDNHQVLKNKV